jgi:hypothetical protein
MKALRNMVHALLLEQAIRVVHSAELALAKNFYCRPVLNSCSVECHTDGMGMRTWIC